MNPRDELATIIWEEHGPWCRHENIPEAAADAILAAGYRKHLTITSDAELEALDIGTLIFDHANDVMKLMPSGWQALDNEAVNSVLLPAAVLYTPKVA